MKMRKMTALLSAAALAVTSLSAAAFAETAAAETEDVSAKCQFMLKLESYLSSDTSNDGGPAKSYDGAYGGSAANTSKTLSFVGKTAATNGADASDTLNFSFSVGAIDEADFEVGDVLTVKAEGLTITAKKDGETDEKLVDNAAKEWTVTKKDGWWDGDQALTLSSISYATLADFKAEGSSIEATWTSLTVTVPKADEGGDDEGGDTTTGTVLTLAPNSWGDPAQYNNQGEISVKADLTAEQVKALEDFNVVINVSKVEGAELNELQFTPIIKGSGGGYIGDYSTGNVHHPSSSPITVKFTSDWLKANVDDATGTISLIIAVATDTSSEEITESVKVTYTLGDQGSSEEPGGDSTTAGGDSGFDLPGNIAAGTEPNIKPVAPSTEAPATEAPEVVTAANGESVEAAKDVVPAGATLEVKEQTKEDAVKAVEAVKATDANKEVVETIKKAVEEAKAAVVDIDLVKDGQKVQPNGTIKVTLNVPEALKDAAKLFVYRVEADGTFTDVNAAVENGKIVFTTNHFSTYIITSEALSGDAVVTEAPAATEAPATPSNPDDKNQATGVVIAVIPALIAAAGVVVSKKRK